MTVSELRDRLERSPVIAAVPETRWSAAIDSPAEVLFHLKANLLTVARDIEMAHAVGKAVLVHIDLAEGIGKDKTGLEYLAACGVDGIISTRGQLIRQARELRLLTVQRFFLLDSQGVSGIAEQLQTTAPDLLEIMPGVIGKAICRFSGGTVPVIAGGLIETKAEVTAALASGATAVSTGKKELWYI